MVRSALRIALAVFGAYALYAGALYLLQDRLLFPGAALKVPQNLPRTQDARLIDLSFESGRSVAFYLPARREVAGGKTGAMIVAHGNGELADFVVDSLEIWRGMGLAILVVEYPGYGRAPGTPTDEAIKLTMVAAHDWLAAQQEIDRTRIVAYGISLGGGAVGLLMNERRLAAAILHSTFTSLREFPAKYGLRGIL